MKHNIKHLSAAASLLILAQGTHAAVLSTFSFDAGSLSVTSELYAGSSGDIALSSGTYGDPAVTGPAWSADATNGNLTILGDNVDTNVNLSTQSQFTFVYTVMGLAAGETLDVESVSFDYTGFDGSVRTGASFGGSIGTSNPADGSDSSTYAFPTPHSNLGLGNGDSFTVKFGLRNGGTGNGQTYTLDNFSLNGTVVPEPSSTALLGLGGLALILRRRK